ncbi:MAG: nuclear transport factor 2 family protein [Litorimonas sp.]
MRPITAFLVLSAALAGCVTASSDEPALPATPEEAAAIEALDAAIFEAAFLTCDSDRLRSLMTDDLEFYHDKYGVIARSSEAFIDGTIPDCLQRQSGDLPYLERRATPGTMQVRKIGEDGLMQTGHHSFWLRPPGEDIREVETGLYTHIWVRDGDGHRISRVISYDHFDVGG